MVRVNVQLHGMLHYISGKDLWDEYISLVTLPSCECATARKYVEHDQQQHLLQFLMGLNDSYMHVRSQILMMVPLPTIGQAFSLLSQEEPHRLLSSVEHPAAVFYSRQGRDDERRRDVLTCDHCGLNGHVKAHCFKLVGYPPGHRLYKPQQGKENFRRPNRDIDRPKLGAMAHNVTGNDNESPPQATEGAKSSFTPAQYAEILKYLSSSTMHSSNTNVVNNLPSSSTNVANMTGHVIEETQADWITDTGANEHMTGNYSLLHGAKSLCASPSSVRLPNGDYLLVSDKGSVAISENILVHDVLFVPNFRYNLLSVSKFTKSYNCCVTFHPNCCTFQERTSGRIIWTGKERHGLYYLSTALS
ncbi:uncharacterized protein [Primulina eburnea]|uniref:uncharacterized protein n=1 Tax=Primulina eburnea TaxID=1245227 RepID=UPI003C6BF096